MMMGSQRTSGRWAQQWKATVGCAGGVMEKRNGDETVTASAT